MQVYPLTMPETICFNVRSFMFAIIPRSKTKPLLYIKYLNFTIENI